MGRMQLSGFAGAHCRYNDQAKKWLNFIAIYLQDDCARLAER